MMIERIFWNEKPTEGDVSGCPGGPNKCKSMKDGQRFRFFKGMPPLRPGFTPKESDVTPGSGNEEIFPPANLPDRAHYVYMIEGQDVPRYECCVLGAIVVGKGAVPFAWFTQSGEFLQGVEALERIGLKCDDVLHDPTETIGHMHEAVQTFAVNFPSVKIVMAIDDGTGMRCSGNDTALMDMLHAWDKARRAN